MAMTATVELTPAGGVLNTHFRAVLSVTNGGASTVGVVSVRPFMCSYSSARDCNVPCAQEQPKGGKTVPAGDVARFAWDNIIYQSAQNSLLVGAEVVCTDGSTVVADAIYVVENNPLGKSQYASGFSKLENSANVAVL
jgi:hypothetical protein